MSDAKLLLAALKARKEQKKTRLEKFHDWVDLIPTLYSAIDTDKALASSTSQYGLSITSLVMLIITSFHQLVVIYTSKRPLSDKILDSLPSLLLAITGITAAALGIWFLAHLLVGTALGVAAASLAVSFAFYNLIKAYAVKWAIGTKYEGKVDTFVGIVKALFGIAPTVDADLDLPDKIALSDKLKHYLSKLDDEVIQQLAEGNNNRDLNENELKTVDKVLSLVEQLAKLDSPIEDPKRKRMIANENIAASWVNLGLGVSGLLLATISIMAILGSIAFPPGAALAIGILGLGLTVFGLFKFGLELYFAWDEKRSSEEKLANKSQELLNKAYTEITLEKNNQILPAPELDNNGELVVKRPEPISIPTPTNAQVYIDLPRPDKKLLEVKTHIKQTIKHYYDKPNSTPHPDNHFFKNAVKKQKPIEDDLDDGDNSSEEVHLNNH